MISDEIKFQLLRLLERDPHLSQRALAKAVGVSVGKVNYCLRALIQKGIVKAKNFYNNKNKSAYAYYLTPRGVQEKAQVTYRFLQQKILEYETLRGEIEEIRAELTAKKSSTKASEEFYK